MESYLSRWKDDERFVELHKTFNSLYDLNNDIETALYARLYILRQLAEQQSNKDADFAECGTYAGMSMYFVADFCKKTFLGIDSFQGVSEPGVFDTDYFEKVKLSIPVETIMNTLKVFDNTKIIKGWIPEVFDSIQESIYSYVHIDVDLYYPTKHSIEYFWPRMVNGGVLICDDYGSYKTIGARKAMDDFFGKENILELPTGQAIVYKSIDF